jgi:hypothetical protein
VPSLPKHSCYLLGRIDSGGDLTRGSSRHWPPGLLESLSWKIAAEGGTGPPDLRRLLIEPSVLQPCRRKLSKGGGDDKWRQVAPAPQQKHRQASPDARTCTSVSPRHCPGGRCSSQVSCFPSVARRNSHAGQSNSRSCRFCEPSLIAPSSDAVRFSLAMAPQPNDVVGCPPDDFLSAKSETRHQLEERPHRNISALLNQITPPLNRQHGHSMVGYGRRHGNVD